MTFVRALQSEAIKLTSVRLWWVLAIILFVYVAVSAAGIGGTFGVLAEQLGGQAGMPAPPADLPPLVYSTVTAVGYVIPLLLGALMSTGEARHQTLTPTFLATPQRGVVLAAKSVVAAVAGAVLGVAGLLASFGAGGGVLAAAGQETSFDDAGTWWLAARVVLAMAFWAVIGVGFGVLVPSQVAAVVIVLAFTQFVEPLLRLAGTAWDWVGEVGRFLPGAASDALVGASVYSMLAAGGVDALEWWQGGLVLAGIALVLVVIGGATTWRRDVT